MFEYVYGITTEKAQSERKKKKKKNVIRIESKLLFSNRGLKSYMLLTSWSLTTPRHKRRETADHQRGLLVR